MTEIRLNTIQMNCIELNSINVNMFGISEGDYHWTYEALTDSAGSALTDSGNDALYARLAKVPGKA